MAGEKEFSVELEGKHFSQETQKYHAKSLAEIKNKYNAITNRQALDSFLTEANCLNWFQ